MQILIDLIKNIKGNITVKNKRYNNIDILKGLGIIPVPFTYTNTVLALESVYTTFCMPIFVLTLATSILFLILTIKIKEYKNRLLSSGGKNGSY